MSFDSLINKCNQIVSDRFSNVDVQISLAGVPLDPIRGIFDENSEVVSPFEAASAVIKPMLNVQDSDFSGISSSHVLTIRGKNYQFDGKPKPDGHGRTLIYLQVKK